MENRLKVLFDFQKFQGNIRLARMAADAEQSLNSELDDEELSFAAAAGETDIRKHEDKTNGS